MGPTSFRGPTRRRLGDFEIVREIGRGGMGVVYEAIQISLNRQVALKVLSCGLGLTDKAVQRFRREAEAAAKLHHTNIVPVYATGEADGTHFYAMEMIAGPSLDLVIRQMRPGPAGGVCPSPDPANDLGGNESLTQDPARTAPYLGSSAVSNSPASQRSSSLGSGNSYFDTVARLIAEVADALECAHGQGVIHRDIKPSNLLLSSLGRLSINDFGLARMVEQPGMTMTGEFVGSPLYMSPEQIAAGRAPLDHRTDIYSLGATLYELLTLQPPFAGEHRDQLIAQIMHKEPPPPRRVNRKVPVDLETICLKAMEKDPDRRYQTAGQMAEDLRHFVNRFAISARRAGPVTKLVKFVRRNKLGVTAGVAILLLSSTVGAVTWKYRMEQSRLAAAKKRSEAEMWVHNHAIPNIQNFIARKDYRAAFELAERAEQAVPEDPILAELLPEFSAIWSVSSIPAGAEVNAKPYGDPAADWRPVGRTPLERVRLPRGLVHWKLTREGYVPVDGFREAKDGRIEFTLDRRDALPDGMVRVAGNQYRAMYYGTEDTSAVELEDYFIDRYEVTNRRFKEFVDAGGYEKREYWKQPFVKATGEDWKPSYIKVTGEKSTKLAWEAAMREFRDATGKPGPATWRDGTFPPGEDEFPVGGVSWYEAAAYAEFVGKSLPTITHWVRASGLAQAGMIMPLSNFVRVGPVRVGTTLGLGPFGTSDMAGNLKEWCWNKDAGDRRCVAGGSWDEYEYMFSIIDYASAWDRSFHNGFRCVKYVSERDIPPALLKSIQPEIGRDYDKETPAPDEIFEVYKSFYTYERSPLNARVDAREDSAVSVHETISLDTAYDQDRVIAHLYLPRTSGPPYQAVIFFPAINAYFEKSFPKQNPPPEIAFLVKAGRAVLWPVYHGMYERSSDRPFRGDRAQIVAEVKDFGRCVDYIDVRKEIDPEKMAYFGVSNGALHGVIQLAVEDRLKVGVLVVGGFPTGRVISPEIDPIHFARRVRMPVLMLNGRNDPFFPVQTSQRPLYQRLGSPARDKMHITYDVPGHSVPPAEAEKEMLAWLDRYLGPVWRQP